MQPKKQQLVRAIALYRMEPAQGTTTKYIQIHIERTHKISRCAGLFHHQDWFLSAGLMLEAPGVDLQVQEKIDSMVTALKKEQADEVKKKALRIMVGGLAFFPKQFTVGVLNSLLNRCPALSKWWCPALRTSPIHLSPLIAIHLSPSLAGGVRLSGCLQFICFPL